VGQIGVVVFSLILLTSILILVSRRGLVDALIEAINRFRGGPPAAMHPSPLNDSILLRKRSRKAED
jgi:hypothetical protein